MFIPNVKILIKNIGIELIEAAYNINKILPTPHM